MKKKDINFLKEYAKTKNGFLVSENYFGINIKHEWKCELGHTWKATPSSIINNGTWCPHCSKLNIGDKLRKKDGIEYLKNLAKKNNGKCLSEKYTTINDKYLWKCKNDHTWNTTAKHINNGTWCPHCNKISKGEDKIYKFLNMKNIKTIREYQFNDCVGDSKKLKFDFYLPDYNVCIEFDGEQHYFYRENGLFANKLIKNKKYDKIKTEYCLNNNIRLIRIPYGLLPKIEKILEFEYSNSFKTNNKYNSPLIIIIGCRPEYIKCIPLIKELDRRMLPYYLIFSGQQNDLLKNIKFDFKFKILSNNNIDRLSNITINNISNFNKFLIKHPYCEYVLVHGDTTTALSAAIAGFYCGKKIIHLEAGLRTFDRLNPFPEETNRELIARLATIHLSPTNLNKKNLINENIKDNIYVVGNTGLDNLVEYKEKVKTTNKVLVTLHRRENHDLIEEYFNEILKLSNKYNDLEFILPIHPNPNVLKHKKIFKKSNVKVINPLAHNDLLNLLVECKFVITDSGGIQEEINFFNKICIVCRKTTERPEALNMTTILCPEPSLLGEIIDFVNKNPNPLENTYPYGDGKSSIKIVDILEKIIYLQ